MRRGLILIGILTLAGLAFAQDAITEPQVNIRAEPRGFRGQVAAPEGQLNRLLAWDGTTTHTGAIVVGQGLGRMLGIAVNVPRDAATTCTLSVEYGRVGNVMRLSLGNHATIDVLDWYLANQPVRAAAVLRANLTGAQRTAVRNWFVADYIGAVQAERAAVDAELEAEKMRRLAEIDRRGPVEAGEAVPLAEGAGGRAR